MSQQEQTIHTIKLEKKAFERLESIEGVGVSGKVARKEMSFFAKEKLRVKQGFASLFREKVIGEKDLPYRDAMGQELSRKWLRLMAPEAVSVMEKVYGEKWNTLMSDEQMGRVIEMAEHGYEVAAYGKEIMDGFDNSVIGNPVLYEDMGSRLRQVKYAVAYEEARLGREESLSKLVDSLKSEKRITEDEGDDFFKLINEQRDKVRALVKGDELDVSERDLSMEQITNEIVPQIIEEASMMTDEGRRKLCARLGITKVGDVEWSIASNDRSTDGQRAMYMIVNQLLRLDQVKKRTESLKPIFLKEVGDPEYDGLVTHGADLLLLKVFEEEGAIECGKHFQEQMRRVILKSRIEEIMIIEEDKGRNLQTVSDEAALRVTLSGMADVFFVVEDMARMARKGFEGLMKKIDKYGFMGLVVGKVGTFFGGVEEGMRHMIDNIPSEFPIRSEINARRGGFKMPDLFAKYIKR